MNRSSTTMYRYPAKLKKFGINDPFLNILVAKYENEISWQSQVKDTDTLIDFLNEKMLPALLERVALPPNPKARHLYVSEKHVDLELALTTDQELNREKIDLLEKCKINEGDKAATQLLVKLINETKKKAFDKWISLLSDDYKEHPEFQLLLLRPLFESSGAGARRPLPPPNENTIDWLYMRIQKERLTPNFNLAKEYYLKSAFGTNQAIHNGWQYIPKGEENAQKLSAVSRGSGWCVASYYYASQYLLHESFYVLYSDGKPVVALRTDETNKTIIECQGRDNYSPDHWFIDIHFFIKTMRFSLQHLVNQYRREIKECDPENQSLEWWKKRVGYWYFAIDFAPAEIKEKLDPFVAGNLLSYIDLMQLEEITKRLNFDFKTEDLIQLMKISPTLYNKLPKSTITINEDTFKEACKIGWIEKIEDKELARNEILAIPEFVKQTNDFQTSLANNFPDDLQKLMVRKPRTFGKRRSRFLLENTLPASENEDENIAVKRVINILLNIETSDFSDHNFPENLRKHPSFKKIREQGWAETIKENPTFYFALPHDLKRKKGCQLDRSKANHDRLLKWTAKVEERPWLLTQKNTVPKTVRYRKEMLFAYIEGWKPYLKEVPWKIWKTSGSRYALGGRVYLSYAALRNRDLLHAMIIGYANGLEKKQNYWRWANDRMKLIPACQLAVLLAGISKGFDMMTNDEIEFIREENIDNNSKDPIALQINKMLNGNGKDVSNSFFSPEGLDIFQLSEIENNYKFNRKVKFGDKIRVLLDGNEIKCSICRSINGYTLVSRGSKEHKALMGLRKGEIFKIGDKEGRLLRIMD